MRRVAAVLDASLESVVLSNASLSQQSPASLAIGLGDEHQGWLGDFAKAAPLLREGPPWEQFLAIPESGPEVSWDLERHAPADALRWAAYTNTTPERAERDFMRPLWRLVISLLDSSGVQDRPPAGLTANLLDRWVAGRLHSAVAVIAQALDVREPWRAAAELAAFVGDLIAWYQPLRPDAGRELLEPLALLLAPFVPHLAEAIRRQVGDRPRPSVHLEDWPAPDPTWEDGTLLANMVRVRRLVELGQHARATASIEQDQLLPGALVGLPAGASWELEDLDPFTMLLAGTLRVTQVKLAPDAAAYVRWRLALNPERPVQRELSPAAVEAALAELGDQEAAHLAAQLRKGMSVGLDLSGVAITLLPDEVSISVQAKSASAVAADADHLVILAVG
jgi:isoleucyl-tRNA synthetase